MKSNHVRAKLKRGEASFGTWLCLPDPVSARLMAGVGFDWLCTETEHTSCNFETLAHHFAAISPAGCAPLVRIPWLTGENIKRSLDLGAWGIVVPMVNTKEEAERVVEYARYHPAGNRSVGGQLHAPSFSTDPATYFERANDEVLVVVMCEHVKGVENLDAICSVPGIDAVFIGPNDLLKSMGRKPAFESDEPEFVAALDHVLKTARKHGLAPGMHVISAEAAKQRAAQGFQFIAIASDVAFMTGRARELAGQLGVASTAGGVRY